MKYIYPAVFEIAHEGGYIVSFPDLPGCYSQGETLNEALIMAHSALAQWISYLSEKKLDIPAPTPLDSVKTGAGEFANLICVDVKDGRAVKRTVSIPKWMDEKAVESGLSLSRVLQDALNMRFT